MFAQTFILGILDVNSCQVGLVRLLIGFERLRQFLASFDHLWIGFRQCSSWSFINDLRKSSSKRLQDEQNDNSRGEFSYATTRQGSASKKHTTWSSLLISEISSEELGHATVNSIINFTSLPRSQTVPCEDPKEIFVVEKRMCVT